MPRQVPLTLQPHGINRPVPFPIRTALPIPVPRMPLLRTTRIYAFVTSLSASSKSTYMLRWIAWLAR